MAGSRGRCTLESVERDSHSGYSRRIVIGGAHPSLPFALVEIARMQIGTPRQGDGRGSAGVELQETHAACAYSLGVKVFKHPAHRT